MVENLPNERVARALAPLRGDPDAIRDVWRRVEEMSRADGKRPTGDRVALVVAAHQRHRRVDRIERKAAHKPIEPLTVEELRAEFREAELVWQSLAIRLPAIRKAGSYGDLPERMVTCLHSLAYWAGQLGDWDVKVTVHRDRVRSGP